MIDLWSGANDEFYAGFFAYLKAKFSNKMPIAAQQQKKTFSCIYHETIVALEQTYNALRLIESRAAYTLDDYEKAKEKGDKKQLELIINFCKQLVLAENLYYQPAFSLFVRDYYFDARIANYIAYCNKNTEYQDLLSSLRSELNEKKNSNPPKYMANFLNFISSYQTWLLENDRLFQPETLLEVSKHNLLCKNVIESFNEIIEIPQHIGTSLFDIYLHTALEDKRYDHDRLFSVEEIEWFMQLLEEEFKRDKGVLLTINYAHRVNTSVLCVSFLIVYEHEDYPRKEQITECYAKKISNIFGVIKSQDVRLVDYFQMIKKVYPAKQFIGKLSSKKQRETFRDTFLKYFLSSMFVLRSETVTKLQNAEGKELDYPLNSYRYYKQKLPSSFSLDEHEHPEPKKIPNKLTNYSNLKDLVDESILQKSHKYFKLDDLPVEAQQRWNVLELLYSGHSRAKQPAYEDIFEKARKVESFITRLIFLGRQQALISSISNQKAFERAPQFKKLSFPLQQLILIAHQVSFDEEDIRNDKDKICDKDCYSTAFWTGVDKLKRLLGTNFVITETDYIERDLKRLYTTLLNSVIPAEKKLLARAKKYEESIRNYIESIAADHLLIMRFRFSAEFDCLETTNSKLFSSMFTDFIENLKRRYTAGVRLKGQVGIFILNSANQAVDVTLFFEVKNIDEFYYKAVVDGISSYWKNYPKNKKEQIETHNKKRGKKYSGNHINPFELMKETKLDAELVRVFSCRPEWDKDFLFLFLKDKKLRQLIATIARFYAHFPLLLDTDAINDNQVKKQLLILGRNRPKKTVSHKKITSSDQTVMPSEIGA